MNYNDFFKDIKKQIFSVYLLYGSEEYVLHKALKQLANAAVTEELSGMNVIALEGSLVKAAEICEQCETLPFMSERKLVVVNNYKLLLSEGKGDADDADLEKLLAYLENPSPSACLVFACTANVDKRKKLFKALQKHCTVEFTALKEDELAKWVEKEVKAAGKSISQQNIHLMLEYTENKLEMLAGELSKLLSYMADEKEITAESITSIITQKRDYNLFKMIDAMLEGNSKKALELLGGLLGQREEPIYILGGISRQYRLALKAYLLRKEKAQRGQYLELLGIPDFALNKLISQINRFDESSLKKAMDICLDADEGMKTGRYLPEIVLYTSVIKLTELKA